MFIFTDALKWHKLSKLTNEIATFEAPKSDIIIESQAWCDLMLVFLNDVTNPCVNLALTTISQQTRRRYINFLSSMYQQLNFLDNLESNQPQSVENTLKGKRIISTDGEVIFYPNFFSLQESNRLFQELENNVNWKQEHIKFYGKLMPLPRLTAWYGDTGKSYTYSGIEQHPDTWTPTIEMIKPKIESVANVRFNSVLLNFYRSGKDSVSWHSDDEPELGQNPIIGSVSFGGNRRFCFKHKGKPDRKLEIELPHGSFLLMKGETQHHWLHQIPKTKQAVKPRINLTFRIVS